MTLTNALPNQTDWKEHFMCNAQAQGEHTDHHQGQAIFYQVAESIIFFAE